MRFIAVIALILASGLSGAQAQQRSLTEGQRWVLAQEQAALNSQYRLSVIATQAAQERDFRLPHGAPATARTNPALGRPQRELR